MGDTMNDKLLRLKQEIKEKREKIITKPIKISNKKRNSWIFKYLNKLFITVILMLITLIMIKKDQNFKSLFYKHVFDTNISFATLNKLYNDYFGSPLPFQNLFKDKIKPVFNEKISYKDASKYKDGVKLTVDKNYLVPILETGIVIFIGEKEEYGKTAIIQQINGIDVWYSNIENLSISLYDFVEKGTLLGEVKDDYLYLVFSKEGKFLDYQDYI